MNIIRRPATAAVHRPPRATSRKRGATPAWADRDAIRAMYGKAALRTLITGIEHHVDHIVPLRHRIVTGLHVHTNMRVIPAGPNMSKGNRHWPDMPTGA